MRRRAEALAPIHEPVDAEAAPPLAPPDARPVPRRGAARPLAAGAADALTRWYPRLRIVGSHHGYAEPGSPQDERALEDINASGADIVLVGMGTPKQELWVDRYADRVDADVL